MNEIKNPISIGHLFFLVTMFGLALIPVANFGPNYWPASLMFATCFVWLYWSTCINSGVGLMIGSLAVFATLIGISITQSGSPFRQASRQTECMNQIRQISLACLVYESEHGHFPPAYTVDDNGVPLHSWRVLILPYLENKKLYEKLDLTKPWNHLGNIRHASEMPEIFRCPCHTSQKSQNVSELELCMTNYVAVVGEETMWTNDKPVKFNDIGDGSSNTILIVESEAHRVHWMSPFDPGIEVVTPMTASKKCDLLSSNHGQSCVAMANGSVVFAPRDLFARRIKAALTKDGGEDENEYKW